MCKWIYWSKPDRVQRELGVMGIRDDRVHQEALGMIIIPTGIVVLLTFTYVRLIQLYNLNMGGSLYHLPFNKIVN